MFSYVLYITVFQKYSNAMCMSKFKHLNMIQNQIFIYI